MKKILLFATLVVALSLTSCGSKSTPEDFAKEEVAITKERKQLYIEVYESGTKANDPKFLKTFENKYNELKNNDADYKAAKERFEAAIKAYNQM